MPSHNKADSQKQKQKDPTEGIRMRLVPTLASKAFLNMLFCLAAELGMRSVALQQIASRATPIRADPLPYGHRQLTQVRAIVTCPPN